MIAKRIIAYVVLSLFYWFCAVILIGAFSYASICHYPNVPGCKTDMTLPIIIGVGSISVYVGILVFVIRNCRSPRSKQR